jgi:hypothetical protein
MEVEMKMVRSLLLGSAAGLVAVAGAQAADMPVKGAAVQYVKICNLYGDGFYYLPGTNICVKLGGYVRADYNYGAGSNPGNLGPWQGGNLNSVSTVVSNTGPNGYNTRWDGGDFVMNSRAYITMDTREQTEYGVLRTYLLVGLNFDSPSSNPVATFNGNRAFLQFAGFTIGLAQSFFDFYAVGPNHWFGIIPSSDTGNGGWKVAGYTATFGNGITSTFAFEEPRRVGIVDTNALANVFGFFGSAGGAQNTTSAGNGVDNAKTRFPDMVYNIRIDQVWGSAQVMFAAHDASAAYYYSTTNAAFGLSNGGVNCPVAPMGTPGSAPGMVACGHPADTLGWAAGVGFRINVPNMNGSNFQFQYTWSKGAAKYNINTQTGHWGQINGGTMGFGYMADGIVNNFTGGIDLTKAQGFNIAYDQHWTPKFWTSIYGGWTQVRYDDAANLSICVNQAIFTTAGAISPSFNGTLLPFNCNNNWSMWGAGSRWLYNFTPAFYAGVEVLYTKLNTADAGSLINFVGATAGTAVQQNIPYQVSNQSVWSFRMRWHRDILP